MSTLADLPEIVGFFSYSRDDDHNSDGGLSTLRRRIQNELRGQLGRSESGLRLWQDAEAIPPGTLWESQIGGAIEQAVFFIPIITPRVVQSKYCQVEFERFLARETKIGRSDLVFPILYIDVPQLKDERRWREHPVLRAIASRQYVDWCDFRFEQDSPNARRAVAALCRTIVAALERSIPDPRAETDDKAASERAAAENADCEREAARAEAEREKQEAETLARLQVERSRERNAEEQRRLAAETLPSQEAQLVPGLGDPKPGPRPSVAATVSPLTRAAVFGLVVQGIFALLGLVGAELHRFEAAILLFFAPCLLSILGGFLLRFKGLSSPTLLGAIAATAAINLAMNILFVIAIIGGNILNSAPLLALSGVSGVIVYALLIGWWFIIARRQYRTS